MHSYIHVGGGAENVIFFPSAQERLMVEYRTLRSVRYVQLEGQRRKLVIEFDDFVVELALAGSEQDLDELLSCFSNHVFMRIREAKGEGASKLGAIVISDIRYTKKA